MGTTRTPEAWFVTLCVRETASVPAVRLRAAADLVNDWETVVTLACEQGAPAYVLDGVTRCRAAVPAAAEQQLRAEVRAHVAKTLLLNVELARLAPVLAAAALPAIVLKGPALVRTLYTRPELRPYGDVDLLVHERDETAVAELLLAQGFFEAPYEAEEARQAQQHHAHAEGAFHRMFVATRTGALVELHTDPLQLGLRPRCEAGRWRRAVPVPGLPAVRMLCPEDQAVQLAVHAHKHGFDRLIWLKDLDLLTRTQAARLDWRLVTMVARAEGVSGSVWLAFDLAQRLLGTPVPPTAQRALRPAAPVRLLLRAIWPAHEIAALEGRMRRRAVQFHAAESWRGMLPSLLVMGRRRNRTRAILESVVDQWRLPLRRRFSASRRGPAPDPHCSVAGS